MKKLLKVFLITSLLMFFVVTPVLSAIQYNYVTYYTLTSDPITLAWENTSPDVTTFDLHLKRFEWDEVVLKHMNIEATEYTVTLPRAGIYIFMVRAKKALTSSEITDVNTMNREALLQFIQDQYISDIVGNTDDLTDQEIKNVIILTGKASAWSMSTTHGQVDGVDKGWWAYGYIEKPGTIVVGSVKELIQVDTVWIHGDWTTL